MQFARMIRIINQHFKSVNASRNWYILNFLLSMPVSFSAKRKIAMVFSRWESHFAFVGFAGMRKKNATPHAIVAEPKITNGNFQAGMLASIYPIL